MFPILQTKQQTNSVATRSHFFTANFTMTRTNLYVCKELFLFFANEEGKGREGGSSLKVGLLG